MKIDIDNIESLCYNCVVLKYLAILKGEWYGFDLD